MALPTSAQDDRLLISRASNSITLRAIVSAWFADSPMLKQPQAGSIPRDQAEIVLPTKASSSTAKTAVVPLQKRLGSRNSLATTPQPRQVDCHRRGPDGAYKVVMQDRLSDRRGVQQLGHTRPDEHAGDDQP